MYSLSYIASIVITAKIVQFITLPILKEFATAPVLTPLKEIIVMDS